MQVISCMKATELLPTHELIKGQEVICPDGLGRIVKIIKSSAPGLSIKVETYIGNRGCVWDAHNIKVPIIYV